MTQEVIDKLIEEVSEAKQKVVEARRQLPKVKSTDYVLKEFGDVEVKLSSLFGDKQDLILIHNMGKECPYCTLWADGFIGLYPHLKNRAAIVLASPNSPEVQKEFAESRNWPYRMVSLEGSTFSEDFGFKPEGSIWPGVLTFSKDADGEIYFVNKSFFGPGDDFCAAWPLFELLEGGEKNWEPKYSYSES